MAKQKQKVVDEKKPKPRLWLPIGVLVALLLVGAAVWFTGQIAKVTYTRSLSLVTGLRENQLSKDTLRVTPQPEWIQQDIVEDVLASVAATNSANSLVHRDLIKQLTKAFTSSPWVKTVRLHKDFRQVRVEITYRKPVLSVPFGPYNWYVDSDGIALPPPSRVNPPNEYRNCLWVEHLSSTNAPQVGERIENDYLLSIARLAEKLLPRKEELGIVAIVVDSKDQEPLVCSLRTRLGSKIMLGELPAPIVTADFQSILRPLQGWLDRFGSLDAPNGPYQFDLRDGSLAEPIPLVALRP